MHQQAANGPDMGFDPEFPVALDDRLRVSTSRAHHLALCAIPPVAAGLGGACVPHPPLRALLVPAQSAGQCCAVVAAVTAPVREVIRHGENGLLLDFFDGAQLVDAVQKVLADLSGMQAMRRAAASSVHPRFGQAQATARYLALAGCMPAIAQTVKNPNGNLVAPNPVAMTKA